jgi:hypothetical protein
MPSPRGLIKHPHCQRNVVVQTQNTLMHFKEGGYHPALQGRKVNVAIGPFGSSLRGRRNIRGGLLGSHFRERKEE